VVVLVSPPSVVNTVKGKGAGVKQRSRVLSVFLAAIAILGSLAVIVPQPAAAALSPASLVDTDLRASQTTSYVFQFTLGADWGGAGSLGGRLDITFPVGYPAGYDISGAGGPDRQAFAESADSDCLVPESEFPAIFDSAVAEDTVTILGLGAGCKAGTTMQVTLPGIKNPGVIGDYSIALSASNVAGVSPETGQVTAAITGGLLTGASATPGANTAGTITSYTIAFTLASQWGKSGTLVTEFPALGTTQPHYGLSEASVGTVTATGTDCQKGGFLATPSGSGGENNIVTLARTGDGSDCPAGSAFSIQLTNVKNPGGARPAGADVILLETRDLLSNPLDRGTASSPAIIAGALSQVSVTAGSTVAGAITTYAFGATLTNPWPSNGLFKATFPTAAGNLYNLAGVSVSGVSPAVCDSGSFTVGIGGASNHIVTVSRGMSEVGDTCPAGTALTILLSGVQNPHVTTTTTIGTFPEIATMTDAGLAIDTYPTPPSPGFPGPTISAGRLGGPGPGPEGEGSATVVPTFKTAGADSVYWFNFTLANPWPSEGKFVVTFPPSYQGLVPEDFTNPTVLGTCPGTYEAGGTPTTRTVTITRPDSECPAGSTLSIALSTIRNPAGAVGSFLLTTTTSADQAIDSDTVEGPVVGPGAMPAVSILPGSSPAGASPAYEFTFTLANPWPANGVFSAIFPGGYSFGAVSGITGVSGSCTAGSLVPHAPDSADRVSFARAGGATSCPSGTTIKIQVNGIRNPPLQQNVIIGIATQNSDGVAIDTGSAASVIVPGTLTGASMAAEDITAESTNYRLSFTLANAWTETGDLVVTFPDSYDLSNVQVSDPEGCNGSFHSSLSGTNNNVLTVQRGLDAMGDPCPAMAAFSMELLNVERPAGDLGAYQINVKTEASPGMVIDSAAIGILGDLEVAVAPNTNAGTESTTYLATFTLANPWPVGGRLVWTLPATEGFDLEDTTIGATGSGDCAAGASFGTLTRIGDEVTVTRTASTPCSSGTPVTLRLTGIRNPTYSHEARIALRTVTAQGDPIDSGAALISITPNLLGGPGNGGTLPTVVPESSAAGARTSYALIFKLANNWPTGGTLSVAFPPGYDLSGVTIGQVGGCAGTFTRLVDDPHKINITNSQTCTRGSTIVVPLANVRNPAMAGPSGLFSLGTFSGEFPADERTIVGPDISPGILGGPGLDNTPALDILPTNAAGAFDTTYMFRFTLANAWPADGLLKVTLPQEYLGSLDDLEVSLMGCDGDVTFTGDVSHVLSLNRDGLGTECAADQLVTLSVHGLRNPGVSGSKAILVNTTTADETVIDSSPVEFAIDAGSLWGATVNPILTPAGQPGVTYNFEFGLTNTWPKDGSLQVQFPPGYSFDNVQKSITGCTSGGFSRSIANGAVSITRDGTGSDCLAEGETITLALSGINNPGASGPASILLQTRSKDGRAIDKTTVTSTITAGTLTSTDVTVDHAQAGHEAEYTFAFTTAHAWPADGKLRIAFPAFTAPTAYDLTGPLTMIGTGCSEAEASLGTFTPSVSGNELTLTRGGAASMCAPGDFELTLRGIKNPSFSGNPGLFSVRTTSGGSSPVDIDVGTAGAPELAAGPLSQVFVNAGETGAGQLADYAIAFDPSNDWQETAQILIRFPHGYDVSDVDEVVVAAGCAGGTSGLSAAPSGIDTIIISHDTGDGCSSSTIAMLITGIRNPTTAGPVNPFPFIKTLTATGATIDEALDVASAFAIAPGPTDRLAFSVEPSDGTQLAGLAATVVSLYDEYGNVVSTDNTHEITLSLAPATAGTATLSGTQSRTVIAGVAIFDDLSVDKVGTYAFAASTDEGAFTHESAEFAVTPITLAFAQQPTGAQSNLLLATQPTVQLLDDQQQVVLPIDTQTVTLALLEPNGALLLGTSSLPAPEGIAAFTDLAINKTGVYSLTASLVGAGVSPVVSHSFTIGMAQFTLDPASGPTTGGTTVKIHGGAFANGATVNFGSVSAANVVFHDAFELEAITPPHAAGAMSVTVTNPDGQSFTAPDGFDFLTRPIATTVSPTAGSSLGGTAVNITGNGFEDGLFVYFGSTLATSVTVTNSTHLTVVAPPQAEGLVGINVTNANGLSSLLENAFTYDAAGAPELTALSRTAGPIDGGTTVTLRGHGFASGLAVKFGNANAASITFADATRVIVVTPPHAAGPVWVNVTNVDGQIATSPQVFTFMEPPVLNSLSANKGPASGGTQVTLTGAKFAEGSTIRFGSVTVSPASIAVDGKNMTAITPAFGSALTLANPQAVVDVVITNPAGQNSTLANAFTYLVKPGSVTITPAIGSVAGGTLVTVAGSNFVEGTSVKFGGLQAAATFVNSTRLTAVTPSHAAGLVSVLVTTPNGMNTTAAFRYSEPPGTFAVTPATATTNGGILVTLTGTNFAVNSTVKFGAEVATGVTLVSSTVMKAIVPVMAAGAVDVTITNPDGLSRTQHLAFVYTLADAPVLTAITPANGSTTGGTKVLLTGTGFASGAIVAFGIDAAAGAAIDDTALRVSAPPHAAGPVDIVITNPDGQKSILRGAFTYAPPAPILEPTRIVEANKDIEVTVTRVGSTNVVSWVLPSAGLPATVQGVQLWRSNSPYLLLQTLEADDSRFELATYADAGIAAKVTTKYLVTMYFGASEDLGFFPKTAPPDTVLYPGAASTEAPNGGISLQDLPAWARILGLIGVLFLIVLVSVLVARRPTRQLQAAATTEPWLLTGNEAMDPFASTEVSSSQPESYAPAPASEEAHLARCPACQTTFTAYGPKPVRMVCPGCGVRGLLR
jgi:hypothetical protein